MNKLILSITAVAGLAIFGAGASTAEAGDPFGFGIRIGGTAVHVGSGYYGGRHTVHRSPYHGGVHHGYINHGAYGSRGVYGSHGCYRAPHYDWHDTSHYDYHPTQVIRHGNHFDVVPGHYDLHRSGHYDLHR